MAEPRKKIVCIEDDHETASLIVEHLCGPAGNRPFFSCALGFNASPDW
jgi:hypothetical protein